MTRWQWFARTAAFAAAIVVIAWLSNAIWAQTELEYARPCPGGCKPAYAGFNQQKWRRWPGEVREDEVNPRAIGMERLPPPEGRKERLLPRATPLQPQQQPMPQPPQPRGQMDLSPTQLPPLGPLTSPARETEPPLGSGTILPPPGTLLPPIAPANQGKKPKSTKPLIEEGEFPGLPDEPKQPKPVTPAKKPANGKSSNAVPVPQDVPNQASERPLPEDPSRPNVNVLRQDNPPAAAGVRLPPTHSLRDDAAVALADNREPVRNDPPRNVYRADSIGVASSRSADRIQPAGYATAESTAAPEAVGPKPAPSVATVALNGYCPVELNCNGRWALGDVRWTVVHRGGIYRLSGPEQRQRFLADPDRYAPVNAGNDVVASVEANRVVPGQAAHCAIYDGRLYMFSSAGSQAEFNRHPERYAKGK